MPGWRSSDFFCRVHFLVPVSTASMMSSAMVRGRGGFLVVIGLLRVAQYDRTLTAIGVLDAGCRQMQSADHGLVGIGAHLGERVLDAFPGCSELAERIADPDAPIRAGDELAVGSDFGSVLRQARLVQAERKLDDVGN